MPTQYALANVLQVKVEDAGDGKADGDVQALGPRLSPMQDLHERLHSTVSRN